MTKVEYLIQRLHPTQKVWKDHKWLTRGMEGDLNAVKKFFKSYEFEGDPNYRIVKRETIVTDVVIP